MNVYYLNQGKVIYADGRVEEGLYEYGTFKGKDASECPSPSPSQSMKQSYSSSSKSNSFHFKYLNKVATLRLKICTSKL